MIKSMTGFVTKRLRLKSAGEVIVNIRSSNFKYLDINIAKVAWGLERIERMLYTETVKKIKRGRLDISIGLNCEEPVKLKPLEFLKIRNAFRLALGELIEFKKIQGGIIKKEIANIARSLKRRSDSFKAYISRMAGSSAEEVKDIFEEVSLIAFYLKHLQGILDKEKSELGKLLDFLSQELLRETNTILAKIKDRRFSLEAVYVKEEIDRLRELAQNIE